MSKTVKIILIVLVIIVITVILYFLLRKKPQIVAEQNNNKAATPDNNPIVQYAPDVFPLVPGARGENVKRLQFALNRIRPDQKIAEDGILGNTTKTKLLVTVPSTLSQLPMSEANYTQILILSRQA